MIEFFAYLGQGRTRHAPVDDSFSGNMLQLGKMRPHCVDGYALAPRRLPQATSIANLEEKFQIRPIEIGNRQESLPGQRVQRLNRRFNFLYRFQFFPVA
mgnify:CR=1 FL=1